jgi:hypothetical protein
MFKINDFNVSNSQILFDYFIVGYGFEQRSSYISKIINSKIKKGYYIGYSDNKDLSNKNLKENLKIFKDFGFIGFEFIAEDDFENWADKFFEEILKLNTSNLTIGIDISCLSRYRLAIIVRFVPILLKSKMKVVFLYNLAQFNEPTSLKDQLVNFSPISSDFTGWSRNHINAPRVIFGLGFEKDRIQVALEELQSSDVFFFVPNSPLSDYFEWVKSGNEIVFSSAFFEKILEYNVLEPTQTFNYMESLIDYRLDFIIVPFGPKIFALLALLLSLKHNSEIGVWRVSPSDFDPDTDRKPSEYIVGLEVIKHNANL